MSTPSNILFVLSDQMVAALTGAYGHPVVQTPHLERLAREGVRFDVRRGALDQYLPQRHEELFPERRRRCPECGSRSSNGRCTKT